MKAFLLRRFLWMLFTLWIVFTVSFALMRLAPGGPFSRERALEPEVEANFAAKYRLDLPLPAQYALQLRDTVRGDFGLCMRKDAPVNRVIAEGAPVSLALGALAMLFAVTFGLSAGILSAARRGGWADRSVMAIATIGISLPSFIVASLSIFVFVFWLGLFPAAGWGSLRQLVLPAFCLGAPYAAELARISRTSMLDVLGQDFIRTARAKGAPEWKVVLRHALPSALAPVVSFLAPALAGMLTGSPVIEQIFVIPGLGWHFVQSALARDYTLSMGLVLLYTSLLYVLNVLADMSYTLINPRVEWE